MIKFYYSLAPNPMKVALFLEEAGLPYEPVPVDTRKGEQHQPAFTAINPNAKLPAIVDGDTTVFDSNAILLYLGGKTGQFMPASTPAAQGELLSWMMFIASGVGPYFGQCVHFRQFAPEPKDYGVTRYLFEAKRHLSLLDQRLAQHEWLLGSQYSIVDMAFWGWGRLVPFVIGADRTDMAAWAPYPNVKRLMDAINARPAAAKAEALRDHHVFKTEFDEVARRSMFPSMAA